MVEFIVQILTLITFLVGVLLAEVLTFRAFGRPKRTIVIVDIVLFVLLVTTLYYYIGFFAVDAYFYAVNFFIGLISITSVRAIEAALGLTEKAHSREDIADKLVPILVKTGMDADEVRQSLRGLGISKAKVEQLSGKIDKGIPPYLPKIVRIYDELDEIKAELAKLTGSKRNGRKPMRVEKTESESEILEEVSEAPVYPKIEAKPEEPKKDKLEGIRHIIQAAIERAEREKREAELAEATQAKQVKKVKSPVAGIAKGMFERLNRPHAAKVKRTGKTKAGKRSQKSARAKKRE